jgi:hypothetical protein
MYSYALFDGEHGDYRHDQDTLDLG